MALVFGTFTVSNAELIDRGGELIYDTVLDITWLQDAKVQVWGQKFKIADTNSNGFVEFMELVDSVSTYVDKETKGEQIPWLSR
jgi:hypothetical protein